MGGGEEVKDKLGSTTISCREKSPPRTMSPCFSSTGRDMEPGIMLHCWLWSWWETAEGKITIKTRPKKTSFVLRHRTVGSADLIQKMFILPLNQITIASVTNMCWQSSRHTTENDDPISCWENEKSAFEEIIK